MEQGLLTFLFEGRLGTSARKRLLIALSRAGIVGGALFLSACGQASSIGSTTGSQNQALAGTADVTIIKAVTLIADPNNDFIHAERITAAIVLPEGGFLAITNIRGGNSFAYKISKVGAVLWRQELPQGTIANSAGISSDGSYWIAGNLSEVVDHKTVYGVMDYAERIGADGVVSPPVILSAKNKGRFFNCAVKSGDNYIQSDSDSARDEYLHLAVQRVSMIDGTGALLWEHLLPFDQGRRIERDTSTFSNPNEQLFDCAGIFIGQNDRIFAAARVFFFPEMKTDEEVFQEMTQRGGRDLRFATLLVALDSKGNPIASVRHDDAAAGLLVASPTGPLLFETAQVRANGLVGTSGQRLSLHKFDFDLREQKPAVVFNDTNFDRVTAGYPTPEGGVLMNACSGDDNTKPVYLRYVSSTGAISPKRPFSELGQMCGGIMRFSPGTQPGEVLVLVQTPQQGNRLLTVRYSQ
jgi:hypothetical protein